MRRLIGICMLLLCACSGKQKTYARATDALDAGREYIQACMEGDFEKAAFYTLPNDSSRTTLKAIETVYRSKDKEGRQQLRSASIQINGINSLPEGRTEIHYNYSFDKQPHTLTVVNHNGNWLVDAAKP